jgi:hypothetical protein
MAGRIRDLDRVALAGDALDVEPIARRVRRQRLAVLADDLDVVRRAQLRGRDIDRDLWAGLCGTRDLIGVGRAAGGREE